GRRVPARGPGDLGHLDQDLHRDVRGVLAAGPAPRPDPRHVPGGRRPGYRRAACAARPAQRGPRPGRADRGFGSGFQRVSRHVLRWAGARVDGRQGGGARGREGAQKLKEVSYLHAEAYPASELKHGPLALVGPDLPTVAVVPDDELRDKNVSTLGEIKARRGRILAVGHGTLDPRLA